MSLHEAELPHYKAYNCFEGSSVPFTVRLVVTVSPCCQPTLAGSGLLFPSNLLCAWRAGHKTCWEVGWGWGRVCTRVKQQREGLSTHPFVSGLCNTHFVCSEAVQAPNSPGF